MSYSVHHRVMNEFPRFMMCKFSQPEKPHVNNYSGYQDGVSDIVHYFEIEILRIENYGRKIIFKSNDQGTSLDRYKDVNGNICMNWDQKSLQYISPGVSYTLPWSNQILTDNIILLPEKKVSIKSRMKNLLSKKILSNR